MCIILGIEIIIQVMFKVSNMQDLVFIQKTVLYQSPRSLLLKKLSLTRNNVTLADGKKWQSYMLSQVRHISLWMLVLAIL